MPVTTRRKSRGFIQYRAYEESVREDLKPEEGASETAAQVIDEDAAMDGPLVPDLSSSSEGDDERGSVWDGPESDVSENGEEDMISESDDDFEATPSMAKRRRLEKAAPSENVSPSKPPSKTKRSGLSRRVQGRLQNMLSLPLDVLFVLFSELGPMDLLNLARTSKALRQVLMSRKSIWVWISARRAAGATMVPDPPEDMSEPAWAQLLFGPAVCSQCSTKNIHRVDFALRRRLCISCKRTNLVLSIKFQRQCPDLRESVMDLLPYTKVGGWAHGHASHSRFYWKPDLYEIGKRLAELENDVEAGKPGAHQRLKSFRAERILWVDSIIQSSSEFERWAKAEAEAQSNNAWERRNQRHEALKARILAAGYEVADISWVGMHRVPGSQINKPLTDDAWRRIRVKVETKMSEGREARLLAVRRRREAEYKHKAEQCYSNLLRQILPIQRLCLPALSQISELTCFRDLLNPNRDVQAAEWENAADQLQQSLSDWMSIQRNRCISSLPPHIQGARVEAMAIRLLSDPLTDSLRPEAMVGFGGPLDLAISVFREPKSGMVLMGRDVCHAWGVKGLQLEFSPRGSAAVHALLQVLQLDPVSTTVSTLDQLDRYFTCASCPLDVVPNHHLCWRSCVLHFVELSGTDHAFPQWQMVGPEDMASYRSGDERPGNGVWLPHLRIEKWLCNHCGDYLVPGREDLGSKTEIIDHLQAEHNVKDVVVNVDLFSYPLFGV